MKHTKETNAVSKGRMSNDSVWPLRRENGLPFNHNQPHAASQRAREAA